MKLFKSNSVRYGALLLATSAVSFAQGIGVGDDPFSQFLGGLWNNIRADAGVLCGIGFILCFVGFIIGRSEGMERIGRTLFGGAGVLGTVGLVAWIQNHVGG